MKGLGIILALSFFITACDPSYSDKSEDYLMPPELSGCKVIKLSDSSLNNMRVLYCKDKHVDNISTNKGKYRDETAVVY